MLIATHEIKWIEKNADALALFSKGGQIWAMGSVQYFIGCSFRPEREPYRTYKVKVEDESRRSCLLRALLNAKRINVNSLAQKPWIQVRAQLHEFRKSEHLFEGLRVTSYEIEENLREALENIFDLKENPNELENAIEDITEFYLNENFTYERFGEWKEQNRVSTRERVLRAKPATLKAHTVAIFIILTTLLFQISLQYLNFLLY